MDNKKELPGQINNFGKKWTDKEIGMLIKELKKKTDFKTIAKIHGRTEEAIKKEKKK